MMSLCTLGTRLGAFRPLLLRWSPPATGSEIQRILERQGFSYSLTGVLTVAALFYLGYVMIRPERF